MSWKRCDGKTKVKRKVKKKKRRKKLPSFWQKLMVNKSSFFKDFHLSEGVMGLPGGGGSRSVFFPSFWIFYQRLNGGVFIKYKNPNLNLNYFWGKGGFGLRSQNNVIVCRSFLFYFLHFSFLKISTDLNHPLGILWYAILFSIFWLFFPSAVFSPSPFI